MSAVEGRGPRSLGSLAGVIDPDALDTLFGSRADDTARPGGRLTSVYSKCRVTVENGEYLAVCPIDPQIRTDRV